MQLKTYEQRILIAEDGKWLYNAAQGIVSDKVYLGIYAAADEWTEITEAEKELIEAELEKEAAQNVLS